MGDVHIYVLGQWLGVTQNADVQEITGFLMIIKHVSQQVST